MLLKYLVCLSLLFASLTVAAQVPKRRPQLAATTLQLLQGAWGGSLEENGFFLIEGKKMYFIEHMQEPIRFQLKADSLLLRFHKHLIIRQQILKLDPDSLVVRSTDGISQLRHRPE